MDSGTAHIETIGGTRRFSSQSVLLQVISKVKKG